MEPTGGPRERPPAAPSDPGRHPAAEAEPARPATRGGGWRAPAWKAAAAIAVLAAGFGVWEINRAASRDGDAASAIGLGDPAAALELEPDRAARLHEVLRRSLSDRAGLARRRAAARRALEGLLRRSAPEPGRVESLLEELLRLRVEAAELDVAEDRRLSAFLSPTERARLHLARRGPPGSPPAGGADPTR